MKKEKGIDIWNARMLQLMDMALNKKLVTTEKEWCEKIGYERTNLPKVKSGEVGFRMDHCIKAAKLTGASMDYIAGLQDTVKRIDKKLTVVDLLQESIRLLEAEAETK